MYACASCKTHSCTAGNTENAPRYCPGRDETELEKIKKEYQDPVNAKMAYQSALVETEGYGKKTRLEEIIDFARKCGFRKLGVAFCIGLCQEAEILSAILRHHGFEVASVVCKNGGIPKEYLGIKEQEKVRPDTYEPMCNPIGQAVFLNKAQTEFDIILGLCVGHDSLFIKYAEAPVTVFAVKDRVLAHNPLGALYLSESYYHKKLYPGEKEESME